MQEVQLRAFHSNNNNMVPMSTNHICQKKGKGIPVGRNEEDILQIFKSKNDIFFRSL